MEGSRIDTGKLERPTPLPGTVELDDLGRAAQEALELFRRVPRDRWVNNEGADAGCSGSDRSLLRHTANYLLAARLAEQVGLPPGPVVDVGGGVGAFGAWLANRLGAPLWIVDPDPAVRSTATEAFPRTRVFADLDEVPTGSAAHVVAMEVIEHIRPSEQPAFLRGLTDIAAPGALVAISTPDEQGFLGGSSGYASHIGTLTGESFEARIREHGDDTTLWRLEGRPFRIGPVERISHPIGNRGWSVIRSVVPSLADWTARQVTGARAKAKGWTGRSTVDLDGVARAVPLHEGDGSGLFAAIRVPSS